MEAKKENIEIKIELDLLDLDITAGEIEQIKQSIQIHKINREFTATELILEI